MNIPIQIERANIRRAIGKLELLAAKLGTNDRDYYELCALDALGHVFDSDMFAGRMADIQHDIGLDASGYPLNDEGDLDLKADRPWVPLPRIQGGMGI